MRPVPVALIGAILWASTALAQTPCEWTQLWLETTQVGSVEAFDCSLQPVWNGVGDEYHLSLNAGDLMTLRVSRGTLRDPHLIVTNPENAIVAATNDVFDGDRQRFVVVKASMPGTYRVYVTAGGYYSSDFGTYAIQSNVVTLPTSPFLQSVGIENRRLRVTWYAPLSPTPILEFLLEVGLDAGNGNHVQVFSVAPSLEIHGWNLFTIPAAAGLYSVRVRARNALGWGPVSSVGQVRYPPPRIVPTLSWFAVQGHVHLDISAGQDPKPLSYEVFVGSAPGLSDLGTLMIPAASGWTTPLDFYGVPAGHYYVRVREWTGDGPGVFVPEAHIVVH